MSELVACPECGEEYEELGTHWRYSSDHRPSFTDHQREIITGLLMGDGCINKSSKNAHIICNMVSKNYLKYIDNKFGCLGAGVRLEKTAEESAKMNRENGCSPNAEPENYSDVYRWFSRRHPELHEFVEWYKKGEKVWPTNIDLTPTVLKHWYCGDGYWDNSQGSNRIKISMSNEVENTKKVTQMFKKSGLPSPSNYTIYEQRNGNMKCDAQFTVDQSKELWKYMGSPLPDFEYKWPKKYR